MTEKNGERNLQTKPKDLPVGRFLNNNNNDDNIRGLT